MRRELRRSQGLSSVFLCVCSSCPSMWERLLECIGLASSVSAMHGPEQPLRTQRKVPEKVTEHPSVLSVPPGLGIKQGECHVIWGCEHTPVPHATTPTSQETACPSPIVPQPHGLVTSSFPLLSCFCHTMGMVPDLRRGQG